MPFQAYPDLLTVRSFLTWRRYTVLAAMHDQLVPGSGDADARLVSEYAQVAARYAVTGSTTQQMGLRHLNEAIAMIHRLPLVGLRLRDGKIAGWQFSLIVSRTDLIVAFECECDQSETRSVRRNTREHRDEPDSSGHCDAHNRRTIDAGPQPRD